MSPYQPLHALHVRGVDGQRLLIPALGLVHVAPQLGDLAPHVQDVVGRGEEVGGLLSARRRLGGLRHADVDLSCQEQRQAGVTDEQRWSFCMSELFNDRSSYGQLISLKDHVSI